MSSCISPTIWVAPGESVNSVFKSYAHQVGQMLFSHTCFSRLEISPSNSALQIMCHAYPVTHTCEPLCTALVTPSQHLRRWDVGKPKQVVMSNSDKKCWHVCLFPPLSDKKKSCCFFPPLNSCYCGLFILLEGISNPLTRGAWKKSVVFSLQQLWQGEHEKPATGFALSLSCVAIQAHGARTVTNDLKLLNYSIFACCHQFHCLFFY